LWIVAWQFNNQPFCVTEKTIIPLVAPLALDQERIRKKIAGRILPFVFILYIISYLDRANVAFAKLNMSEDLKFSEAVFGFGAGIFFIGYLALEIPGALIVEHWSARKWFARILITWGCCTVLVGLVRTPIQFYAARFLLGVAEAGFFPGLIVYFTHWFRSRDRARALSGMIMAIPFGLALGAPVSALILQVDWLGLAGWRWVFILEGLPAVVFGVITLFYLTDFPRDAKWLAPREREWITAELETEKQQKKAPGRITVWQALRQRNVWFLAFALCAANAGGYAFGFWLPTTIKNASGVSASAAAAWTVLPYACGLIAMYLAGRSSDRTGERKLHTSIGQAMTAIFLALSTVPGQSFPMVMFWLCLTGAAAYSWPPPFWVLPTLTLTETAAAASIGLINSVGNLGGFIGPYIFGWLRSQKISHNSSLLFLASCYMLAAILVLAVRVRGKAPSDANTQANQTL
jgi:ACS family tartrate transporter-like MFS transporter